MKNLCIVILSAVIVFLLTALLYLNSDSLRRDIEGAGNISYAFERERAAEKADKNGRGDIYIATMLLAERKKPLINGINLACSEINAQGGINGRKISIILKKVSGTVEESKNMVQKLAENENIIAIIGGMNYDELVSMSTLCQFNGILLISPIMNSGVVLNQKHYSLVFSNYPTIKVFVKKIYEFLDENKLENTGIITAPELTYSYYFANVFDSFRLRDHERGYGVADRMIYHDWADDANLKEIVNWEYYQHVDNILIGGRGKAVINIVQAADKAKIKSVLILDDEMEDMEDVNYFKSVSRRVYLPSVYDPELDKAAVKKFRQNYLRKYGEEPDVWAAQGYDTLKLIAAAIRKGKSTVPAKVAEELYKIKYTNNVSVAPCLSFDRRGYLISGAAVIKYPEDGTFKVLRDLKLKNLQRTKSPIPKFISRIKREGF